jgi:hypothetical protein
MMCCPTCHAPIAGAIRVNDVALCVDCARVALGHVRDDRRRASKQDVQAFVDYVYDAEPNGRVVRDIVAAMHARCA